MLLSDCVKKEFYHKAVYRPHKRDEIELSESALTLDEIDNGVDCEDIKQINIIN